jgi:hypothetical protein
MDKSKIFGCFTVLLSTADWKKKPTKSPIARGKNNSTAFFFQIDSRTLLFSGNTVDV